MKQGSPILLRYSEIALKSGNRDWFESKLVSNITRMLRATIGEEHRFRIDRKRGRMILVPADAATWPREAALEALKRVFGLASFSPARPVMTDLEEIRRVAVEEFGNLVSRHGLPATYVVRSRRSDKVLPQKSLELDRIIGSDIKQAHPSLTVDIENAQVTVGVEIRKDESFIWLETIPGLGGMPVGTNGQVMCLLSGGLDSPVAAIKLIKRGAACSFVHFYGTPFVGEDALLKVEDLVRAVNRYQPHRQPIFVVPFGKIQEKIALATNPKMRTVIYRRMMFRIAAKLAEKRGALALVTGESLGQVASQTLENLSTIDSVAPMPVLRPLIGMDKDEIIQDTYKFATYEISIRPAPDCCTLFADRHPVTRATPALIEEQESKVAIDELVAEAVAGTEMKVVY